MHPHNFLDALGFFCSFTLPQKYDHAASISSYITGVNAVVDKYLADVKTAGASGSAAAGGGRARSAGVFTHSRVLFYVML